MPRGLSQHRSIFLIAFYVILGRRLGQPNRSCVRVGVDSEEGDYNGEGMAIGSLKSCS